MGRLFTWVDTQEGQVPTLEAFDDVTEIISGSLLEQKGIESVVLAGSCVRGDHTRRSDMDYLVIYDPKMRDGVIECLRGIVDFVSAKCVPIEFIPVSSEVIATPHHHLAPSFIEHIHMCSIDGGLLKGDMPDIHQPGVSEVDDVRQYLQHKSRRLEKGSVTYFIDSKEQKMKFLQNILSVPTYAARKMLRAKGVDMSHDDSKKKVCKLYQEVFSTEASFRLATIVDHDALYTELLNAAMAGLTDSKVYSQYLYDLVGYASVCLDFLEMNLQFLEE